ncbi:hypothetical protein OG871_18160 [Kitasatospora sp. NBC_00374]|uniref:hypothetical protein n=1 Tax=Kitasatospora sp. NBC_00374 TaxID=2975964 RepID=UPI0030E4A73E
MTAPRPGDRPLADCLDDFWRGDFALRAPDDPPGDRPGAQAGSAPHGSALDGSALDGLGPSGITLRGRDLADLLAPAYRRFTGS